MPDPVADVLRAYITANYLPHTGAAALADDQDLFDTGILDSASALALLFFVEERFAISVPDDDFLPENFASVAAAAAYIESRRRPGTGGRGEPDAVSKSGARPPARPRTGARA